MAKTKPRTGTVKLLEIDRLALEQVKALQLKAIQAAQTYEDAKRAILRDFLRIHRDEFPAGLSPERLALEVKDGEAQWVEREEEAPIEKAKNTA